ncbi:MAG: N-acetylneuraminate synthase family protein [Bacteroidales bacterium]|nr:N-acetylneuraminate synthase family protein [Bacteroidales bacterium]
MKQIKIGNRIIGNGAKPYFIADIGANHDGELERALMLIEMAKKAGADAAKFQNFKADKIVSDKGFSSFGGQLTHQANWKKPVVEVYDDASISYEWTKILKEKCKEVDIEYFTSAYDFESVDHVDSYLRVYKIGSGDITWLEIIKYIAQKGKPVIIATGASEMKDVVRMMNTLEQYTDDIVLMQCNTNYTAKPKNFKYINLNVLKTYKQRFPEIILGLSDHTHGHATVLGAIALGATVIEKHFTDDNNRIGPDHKFAMNPKSWREMVDRSNELFYALGDGVKRVEENEIQTSVVQRRGLRYNKDLKTGKIIEKADLISLRPVNEGGFAPYEDVEIIGKILKRDISKDDPVLKIDL